MTKILYSSGGSLWSTDGTAAGTAEIKSFGLGPLDIVSLGNGKALFAGLDFHGYELWITDGTAAGTAMVADLVFGQEGSVPSDITPLGNGRAVFRDIASKLWVTDGTAAGTKVITDMARPSDFTKLRDGRILFDGVSGLWVTDGTAGGTKLIGADTRISNINMVVLSNSKAVFSGFLSLWVTNGVTVSEINIAQPVDFQDPEPLGNGKALFSGRAHKAELWITDGTIAGTHIIKDFSPGSIGPSLSDITAIGNGKALFAASFFPYGAELWITDGTVAGTHLVKDIYPGINSSGTREITALGNGKAIFVANDGTHGHELWVTDGTAVGTTLLDMVPGGGLVNGLNPSELTAIGDGRVLFNAGLAVWVTDGTIAGTVRIGGFGGFGSDFTVLEPPPGLRLIGTEANDVLHGGPGDDTLFGRAGNDVLIGGPGADVHNGGAGTDRAQYSDSSAGLTVDLQIPANNTGIAVGDSYILVENLYGSNFADDLRGNAGANTIWGTAGNDTLSGRAGNDTLFGGNGNDVMIGGAGADVHNGGTGIDRVQYTDSPAGLIVDLQISASNTGIAVGDSYIAVENLYGSNFNDNLRGNAGANSIWGAAGNDTLKGRAGSDTLIGGPGPDRFAYDGTASGFDLITDFSGTTRFAGGAGEGDKFTFDHLLHGTFQYRGGNAFLANGNSQARVQGGQVRVDTDGNGVSDILITVTGLTSASQLVAGDFQFTP
jgi:ELWxxDGT repeat protein